MSLKEEIARLPNAAPGLYCPCLYYVSTGCVPVVCCAATNGAGAMGKHHQVLLGNYLLRGHHHDRSHAVLIVLLRRKISRRPEESLPFSPEVLLRAHHAETNAHWQILVRSSVSVQSSATNITLEININICLSSKTYLNSRVLCYRVVLPRLQLEVFSQRGWHIPHSRINAVPPVLGNHISVELCSRTFFLHASIAQCVWLLSTPIR